VANQPAHIIGEFLWRKNGTCFPTDYWLRALERPQGQTCFVATVKDITEIEQAKDALRSSEEKYRRILASTPDVAWTSNRNGRTIYISPKAEATLGFTPREIYAGGTRLWLSQIHAEDFGRVNQAYAALFEKRVAFDEEYRIRRSDGTWIWVHDRSMGPHEENEELYADGFLSDITRRKQAEAKLHSQTAFLEAQTNSTIDGMLVVDRFGHRLMANERLSELLNLPAELLADKDDGKMLRHVVTLVKDPECFLAKVTYLYRHPDETSRDEIELKNGMFLDRYSSPVVDKNGIYYGRIWTFRDITERKRNEDSLQQLSLAVEQSPVSVVITDPQGSMSYVNRKFTECTGYTREEVLGKNPRMLNARRASPDFYRNLWSTITQGQVWHGEFCNQKKNGGIYWESASITPITNPKGIITHFLAVKEDITERKRAEEALTASEKRYRLLFERNQAGVLRTTMEGHVLECNQAAAHMFGYDSPEEARTFPATNLYYNPSDRDAFLTKLNSEKSLSNQEMRFRRKDGDPLWVIASFAVANDDAIPQRVFWKDRNSLYLGCNRAFATDAGLSAPAAIIGKSDFDLAWTDVAERYRADDRLVMEKELPKLNFHEHQSRPDGSLFWLQTNKLPLRDRDGKVTGVIGTYEDVTERKQAEEKIRELLDSVPEAMYGIDTEGKCTFCNPSCLQLVGYEKAEELLGKNMHNLIHHSLPYGTPYPVEQCHIFEAIRRGQGTHIDNEVLWRRDGSSFFAEYWSHPIHRDGKVIGAVVTFVDITERRRAEKELRLTRSSLENASDGVFWMDPHGHVVYANEAACRSLGRSREELLSLPTSEINPGFPREAWDAFWEQIKTQGSMTFEAQHLTKQGQRFPVEVTANYVEFDEQEYCFAFARDITERRALESQLRQAQKLEGIGQLAAGIAHEINTPIQFVTDNLTFLRDSWKSAHELLEQYRGAVRDAAAVLPPDMVASLGQAEQGCDLDFVNREVPRAIDQSLDGAGRVAKIVRAMKEFSHPDAAEKTATDLNKAIESTITVARNEWKYVSEVVKEFDESLAPVVCYPGDINRLF
jgi:PAS domain S-box-containing protein